MPITDKNFFIEHYDEVKEILDKRQIQRCVLGHFKSTGLQMMLDAKETKQFYQVQNDLQKLADRFGVIFAVSFSAFSAAGQPIPLPIDAVDFKLLQNDNSLSSIVGAPEVVGVPEITEESESNSSQEINALLETAKKLVRDIIVLKNKASNRSQNKNIRDEIKSLIINIGQEDDQINEIIARVTPEVQEAFFTMTVK